MKQIRHIYTNLILILILVNLIFVSFYIQQDKKSLEINPVQGFSGEMIETKANPVFINWQGLEKNIREILGSEINNYAVVVQDLSSNQSIKINENKIFPPASIYKVPLAIIVLNDVDNGKTTLDKKYLVTSAEKMYMSDPLYQRKGNYNISLKELIFYLISHSDNTAMTTLEHRFGGVSTLQVRMDKELDIQQFTRRPLEAKASEVTEVFEGLYHQKYLKPETNEFLLEQLKNIQPWFNDRIPAGLPKGVQTAHKIGNLNDVYADAGIVYGEQRDYIIVILNEHIDSSVARNKGKKISEVTYNYLNPKL